MNITNVPSAEEVLHQIQPLTAALYDYFPEAARIATAYFKDRGRLVNSILLPCLIRYEVKEALQSSGIPVEDDEEDGSFQSINIPMEQLANNGIEGSFNSYQFKILKSDDGLLPIPQSPKKIQFYSQQLPLELGLSSESAHPNIVILWAFDANYETVRLLLSVPKEGGKFRAAVKDYFTVDIQHPATMLQGKSQLTMSEAPIEPEITVKEAQPVKDR